MWGAFYNPQMGTNLRWFNLVSSNECGEGPNATSHIERKSPKSLTNFCGVCAGPLPVELGCTQLFFRAVSLALEKKEVRDITLRG